MMQRRETQTWYDSRALEKEDKGCSVGERRHGMERDRLMLKTTELETTHQRGDKEMQLWELGKTNLRVTKRTTNKYSTYLNHIIYRKFECDMDLHTKEDQGVKQVRKHTKLVPGRPQSGEKEGIVIDFTLFLAKKKKKREKETPSTASLSSWWSLGHCQLPVNPLFHFQPDWSHSP